MDAKPETPRAAARRRRFLVAVGPHKAVSEVRVIDVPAKGGIIAHKDYRVDTACRRTASTTGITRDDTLVRCPDCLAEMAADAKKVTMAELAQEARQYVPNDGGDW